MRMESNLECIAYNTSALLFGSESRFMKLTIKVHAKSV